MADFDTILLSVIKSVAWVYFKLIVLLCGSVILLSNVVMGIGELWQRIRKKKLLTLL